MTVIEKKYIQVTESMLSEDVRKREFAPLQSIRDNYEKIVLSLDPGLDASYDGIKSENLIDWLLDGCALHFQEGFKSFCNSSPKLFG